MFKNVNIVATGSYCPKIVKNNEEYIEHYKKYHLDDKFNQIAEKLGVQKRKLAKKGETTLTMAVESSKEALKNSNLKSTDIDIIISATNTPEFLTPCCAVLLRDKLSSSADLCYDINCDCIGMLQGIDQACMYLKTNKRYKRAMIVGSFLYSKFSKEDDIITNGMLGDNSTAIILEVKEEETERGFLSSVSYTDSNYSKYIKFPKCGFANILNQSIKMDDKKVDWQPFSTEHFPEIWDELIRKSLSDIGKTPEDVSVFFMSQFSKEEIDKTMDKLNIPKNKAFYIGYKYGYTGVTSPLLALHLKLKEKSFKTGEYCIFCSVGAGITMVSLVYKW